MLKDMQRAPSNRHPPPEAAKPAPPPEHAAEGAHTWRFLLSPHDAWAAMYADCRRAARSIDFEQYIFAPDRLGKRFFALFRRKARQGVRVRLVLDTFGSLGTYFSPWVKKLRAAGVEVRFYRPFRLMHFLRPWRLFPRTHAKTLLIDDMIAYTGGVCFSEKMRHWRDTHVRITGPAVREMRALLSRRTPPRRGAHSPPWRIAFTHPFLRRNPIYRELRERIRGARRCIRIASAYFIPPGALLRLLERAAARGVEVSLLLPAHSDVPAADTASLSYFPRLLKRGIRVFLFQPTVFHGKVMIVDGDWATVGSMNIDYLSLYRNRETNLILTEPQAVAELSRHFERDLKDSLAFTWSEWRALPRRRKWAGRALRLFHPFL